MNGKFPWEKCKGVQYLERLTLNTLGLVPYAPMMVLEQNRFL